MNKKSLITIPTTLLLAFTLYSCSSSSNSNPELRRLPAEDQPQGSATKEVLQGTIETSPSSNNQQTADLGDPPTITTTANTLYIKRVHYYQTQEEFGVELFYKEGVSYDEASFLWEQSWGHQVTTGDATRKAFPHRYAEKFFVLDGLQEVQILHSLGQVLGRASFDRAEVFEDMLEHEIRAALKPVAPVSRPAQAAYAVSGPIPKKNYPDMMTPQPPEGWDALKKELGLKPEFQVLKDTHLADAQGRVYSLLSYTDANYRPHTFIYQTEGGETKQIFMQEGESYIQQLYLLPFLVQGAPAFFAEFGVPDTDNHWDGPLVLQGNAYQHLPKGIVKLK